MGASSIRAAAPLPPPQNCWGKLNIWITVNVLHIPCSRLIIPHLNQQTAQSVKNNHMSRAPYLWKVINRESHTGAYNYRKFCPRYAGADLQHHPVNWNPQKCMKYKKLTNISYNSQQCTLSSTADKYVSIFVIFMQMEQPKKLMKNEFSFMHNSWIAVY